MKKFDTEVFWIVANDGMEAGEAVVNGGDRTTAVAGDLWDREIFEAIELDDRQKGRRARGWARVETMDEGGEGSESDGRGRRTVLSVWSVGAWERRSGIDGFLD
ncbi:MAG: hypothetical protein C5B50_27385 [Verrucomicrobia bacterium]|nr:MAG: hypothetical protein C5B50_27385 [Verrucomicrobiota bacterium]